MLHTSLPLVEPIVVPDIVVTDLPLIEHIGGDQMRFTFAVKQTSILDGETVELIVASRLVLARGFVIVAARAALKSAGWYCICSLKRMVLH